MIKETNWLEFLYTALGSQYGVVIAVSDVDAAKQALYRARSKSGDPDLSRLQLRTSPTDPLEHIWVVKDAEEVNKRA